MILVIDRGNGFERIQVKTARIQKGVLRFSLCSSTVHRKNGCKQNYRGQCDLFAAYSPKLNKVYMIPVKDVGITECSLRIDPTKNNNSKLIRWAKDFEI